MSNKKVRSIILWPWEVAEILWLSQWYIAKLVRNNKIPHQKISAWTVFLKSEILEYKKEREERAMNDPRIKIKWD